MTSEMEMRKRAQTQSALIFAVIFIPACTIFAWIAWNLGFSNNWKMRTLNSAFNQVAHPPETTFISERNDIGLLIGNGDHCDFFVGQLRSFTGSPQKLEAFYSTARYWSSLENTWDPANVIVLKDREIPQAKREYLPSQFDSASKWQLPMSNQNQKYYIVYFFDVGYDAGMDVRCM